MRKNTNKVAWYSFEIDIWALGCILYYLVVLKHPFATEKGWVLHENVMKGVFDEKPL